MGIRRKLYPVKSGKINGYKYMRTSNHEGGVVIFIKKRLLGFLWWVFVKDENGCPVTYNKIGNAEAFMNKNIKYTDMLHYDYELVDNKVKSHVRPMEEEDAHKRISEYVKESTGDEPDPECVKRAWEFDNKEFCHVAKDYAILWHNIHKAGGKKIWIK